jgi:hypothetical protein
MVNKCRPFSIFLLLTGMMINTALIYSECFPTNLPSALGLSNLFRNAPLKGQYHEIIPYTYRELL